MHKIAKIITAPLLSTAVASLTKAGAEPVISTPQEFSRFLTEQVARAAHIVKAAGIKPE